MGNCCLKSSRSSVWAETDENEQWVYYSDPDLQQKERLISEEKNENKPKSSLVSVNENKNKEVKIMVSKKKLEELLGKVEDIPNIPVDQILDRLLDSSDRFEFYNDHHHHKQQEHTWKPNLSSIPEEHYMFDHMC